MQGRWLLLALAVAAIAVADSQKVRRRHRRLRTTTLPPAIDNSVPVAEPAVPDTPLPETPVPDTPVQEPAVPEPAVADTEDELLELSAAERLDEKLFQESERARVNEVGADGEDSDDPCLKVHCSAGRVCELDEHGDAACNCIKECPSETDSRRKVCTSHNETWSSDCEVYRQRCLCLDGSELCRAPRYHHVQIEYYGACREMPECTESEMADFPRRMRDWLFNIMRDLAARRELPAKWAKRERQAEHDLSRRWAHAAVWKWCDLDAHDNDRFVSRHELFPIRAPLMALEHCIAPFLDGCDADDDHRVSLAEWGRCLQLDEFELEDRCDEFTEHAAHADDSAERADADADAD